MAAKRPGWPACETSPTHAQRDIGDSQLETTLLRSCLALPKVSYVLRACPPSHICHTFVDFDRAIRETLESVLGGPISDWSWLKASLPSSRGGLSLRSASLHAPAAFLASSSALVERILGHSAGPSPQTSPAVSALATAAAHPDWSSLDDIDVPLHQRSLSLSIDEASFQRLLSSAPSIRSHALALSSSLPHAGDWLNVVPSTSLGLHLQDREFRCCLRYWLGIPLHSNPFPSLVPRPLPPRKKGPGIYCSRMREIIARMYGKGSVNVSVNGFSHMARS